MPTRQQCYVEDLVDQLFKSSEKRLARVLLLLTHSGRKAFRKRSFRKISQERVAEMFGTSRSRVSLFMNRFRKLAKACRKNYTLQNPDFCRSLVFRGFGG
jgi:CRP/FNR family transcriptional regulator, cyclic AMP receptor protein